MSISQFIFIDMKNILKYKDYREYMQDVYNERKRTSVFSWREFSALAGFTSPIYMKLVCEGKSSLSKTKMGRVAQSLGLEGYEREYFEQMVIFGNAKADKIKKEALLKMEKIAREHKARVIDSDAFEYYGSWMYPVIRELAPMMQGALPKEMADVCHEAVSAEEVRNVLSFLTKTGFLKKTSENHFVQTEKTVIGSMESLPIAIRAMHNKMAELAVHAVDKYSPEERHFLGVTLGVNDESYGLITEEIEKCCKKIMAIAEEHDNINQVYRLNFQLFPFTKKYKCKKEKGNE